MSVRNVLPYDVLVKVSTKLRPVLCQCFNGMFTFNVCIVKKNILMYNFISVSCGNRQD